MTDQPKGEQRLIQLIRRFLPEQHKEDLNSLRTELLGKIEEVKTELEAKINAISQQPSGSNINIAALDSLLASRLTPQVSAPQKTLPTVPRRVPTRAAGTPFSH